MIVAISGVDGAGKTTQIHLLADALKGAGLDPLVLWFRPGYSRVLDEFKQALRRRRPTLLPSTAQPDAREAAFAKPWIRAIWLSMAISDVVGNLGVWVRWQSARGRVVLCDRYLHDAILDLELRFEEFGPIARVVEAALSALLPRPVLSVLLMVPRSVMHERLALKNEPFPDPVAVRDLRYDRYCAWGDSGEVTVLDGTQPVGVVHRELVERLREALHCDLEPVQWSALDFT